MRLTHPTATNVVPFCDGAQLHVCTTLCRTLYAILGCCKHLDHNTRIYQTKRCSFLPIIDAFDEARFSAVVDLLYFLR